MEIKCDDGNKNGETRKPRRPYKLLIRAFYARRNRFTRNIRINITFSTWDTLSCGVKVYGKYEFFKCCRYGINNCLNMYRTDAKREHTPGV